MDFTCEAGVSDGMGVIELAGEADVAGIEKMHAVGSEVIGNPTVRSVVVDCAGVTFCDSMVLSVLVDWRNECIRLECSLTLRRVPRRMMRVLQITKLDDVFGAEPLSD